MATTGFWPVKSRLKEVIDYAENPDKTIDKKYVDSDLYAALQYVSNDGNDDVAYRNEQGNCIDSFHSNRQRVSITLWGIPQSPKKSKKGLML